MAGPSAPPTTALSRPCQYCHDKKRGCEQASPCQRCRAAGRPAHECVEWEKNPPSKKHPKENETGRAAEEPAVGMSETRPAEKKVVALKIAPEKLRQVAGVKRARLEEKKIVVLKIAPENMRQITGVKRPLPQGPGPLPHLANYIHPPPPKRRRQEDLPFPQNVSEDFPLWDELPGTCEECQEPPERHAFWCSHSNL